jgi:uncharacterized protein (TIGR03435 family)
MHMPFVRIDYSVTVFAPAIHVLRAVAELDADNRGRYGGFAMNISLWTTILLPAICALAADQAKFETASVKKSAQCSFDMSSDPGMISLKGIPLQPVLLQAFAEWDVAQHMKVKQAEIEGAPSWTESPSDCFDIIAKMPAGATRAQLPELLRTLLAERFHLTWHKENRQKRGYALVVEKGGPKLKEDDPAVDFMGGRGSAMIGPGRFKQATTMVGLASTLANRLGDPVEDQTGLTAKYDIDLAWTPDPTLEHGALTRAVPATPGDPGPDLPTALHEFGLKLERRTVSVDVVVIDHIDRVPTGN